jgi:hypothetical protein
MRGVGGTPGIAGDGTGDAFDMLKDALDAPETTAGEDSHFGRCLRVRRFIERRRRDRSCTLRRRREPPPAKNRAEPGTPPRYFDGTPFLAAEVALEEIINAIINWLKTTCRSSRKRAERNRDAAAAKRREKSFSLQLHFLASRGAF